MEDKQQPGKMKTEFDFVTGGYHEKTGIKIRIEETHGNVNIYLGIPLAGEGYFMRKEEIEEFAINILKATKSKRFKQ